MKISLTTLAVVLSLASLGPTCEGFSPKPRLTSGWGNAMAPSPLSHVLQGGARRLRMVAAEPPPLRTGPLELGGDGIFHIQNKEQHA